MKKKFHLAWFTNARPHAWMPNGPDQWGGRDVEESEWASGRFLMDMARSLERACFDYIMLEDHVASEPTDNMESRIDPFPMLPMLGSVTTRLGLIATMSTSFWPPYLLARLTASVDHITAGRSGWNVVTTSEDYAARSFGLGDKQPPHDERYERADEMVEYVKQLWDAWEPDAVIADANSGKYVDRRKLREFEFKGKYFQGLGPLNVSRSPQGRPVICQAGGSPRGMDFAAKHADTVLASSGGANDPLVLKDYRDSIRTRAAACGRNPDDVKVLYLVSPILGDTDAQAQENYERRYAMDEARINAFHKYGGAYYNLDFSKYDLDAPFTDLDLKTEGHQSTLDGFLRHAQGGTRTLRQMIVASKPSSLEFVGTPESVADQMEVAMDAIGGDGFLIQYRPLTRRYITEITEGLVPALQRRGLVRTEYKYKHLRENLLEF
ncbi:NtaA/DmoA family FMN-dependent monooxygenase [Granulicella sibirica]|uniref:Nitrilotriacetate monooxygenase component A n=1 Tax=Granulicella sibirica TaxID=2479048 RepID=A0A4Q0SYV6_9BACT|nr:NtaA/DmoA family FMN-dependent monooxygenase [Granulicella sibirica]RXH54719.1 Nitrilotriacetate monooxygenase component A [Granulicella sibirica]